MAGRAHEGAVAVFHEGTRERAVVSQLTDGFLRRLAQRGLRAKTLTDARAGHP